MITKEIQMIKQIHLVGRRIMLSLSTFCLAACSMGSPIPQDDPGARDRSPAIDAVELPAVWTPTMSPTPPATTESSQSMTSSAPDHLDLVASTPIPASLPTTTWQKVEGATASFMLPTSFEVLDMGSEFGMLMAALITGLMEGMMEVAVELGEELGAAPITPTPMDLSDVEAAFNIDFVLAMEDDQKTSAFLFSEPLEEPPSLEEQMQAVLDDQDNPIEIIALERVMNTAFETGRLSLLATDPETGERGQLLIYVILLPDRMYQLGYATEVELFDEALAIFETSASTFRINP